MPKLFHRFISDRRGTTFEGIALSVSIMAVGFVASADMLDYMVKRHGYVVPGGVVAKALPATTKDLDDTPTASLPRLISRSVLDPCTGLAR